MVRSVDDVDMYTGMLSEFPVEGGVLGPTVSCLITDQFLRLKFGDRFWYETPQQPQAFTPGKYSKHVNNDRLELDEIRKTTLAGLICDTSDSVEQLQPYVMRSTKSDNTPVKCSSVPRPNLSLWKETDGEFVKTGFTHLKLGASVAVPQVIKAVPKTIRIGARVTGGSVTMNSGTWKPTFPVTIPVSPFDAIATSDEVPSVEAPTYGHSIVWRGTLSEISPSGDLTISATFSLPKYVHGTNLFFIEWLNGNIQFHLNTVWNATGKSLLPATGLFSSSVHFKDTWKYSYLKDVDPWLFEPSLSLKNDFSANPNVVLEPKTGCAVIILLGSYSSDRSLFLWSGELTLVLSTATEEIAMPASSKLFVKQPNVNSLTDAIPSTTRVVAAVTGGSVSTSSGSWTSTFPVGIPVYPFDDVASSYIADTLADTTLPVYGHGIIWQGTVSKPSLSETLQVSGSFSLPKFMHADPSTFSIQWLNGDFTFHLQPLYNITGLDSLPITDVFSSSVYFQERKEYAYLKNLPPPSSGSLPEIEPIQKTLTLSAKVTGGSFTTNSGTWKSKFPVTLPVRSFDAISETDEVPAVKPLTYGHGILWRGTLSEILPSGDVTLSATFSLPRYLTLVLSTATEEIAMPASSKLFVKQSNVNSLTDAIPSTTRVVAAVTGGSVSTSSGSWTSTFPVGIPVYPFDDVASSYIADTLADTTLPVYGHGIIWQGTVSKPSLSETLQVSGSFSLPKFMHADPSTFSIQWLNGDFTFHLQPLYNITGLDSLPITDVFSSSVYFQERKEYAYLKNLPPPSSGSLPVSFTSTPSVVGGPDVRHAPIIMLGAYSLDESVFWWSGKTSFSTSAVEFWRGSFTFDIDLATNTSLEGLVNPDITFTSPVYFTSTPVVPITTTLFSSETAASTQAPIILEGNFSPDRSSFSWTGNAKLILPTMKLLESSSKSVTKVSVGAEVRSGNISVSGTNVWSGSLPVPIPVLKTMILASGTPIFGNQISWSGNLVTNSSGEVKFTGTFSSQNITGGSPLSGDFSFDLSLVWNTTVNGLVKPSSVYSSIIILSDMKASQSNKQILTSTPMSVGGSLNVFYKSAFMLGYTIVNKARLNGAENQALHPTVYNRVSYNYKTNCGYSPSMRRVPLTRSSKARGILPGSFWFLSMSSSMASITCIIEHTRSLGVELGLYEIGLPRCVLSLTGKFPTSSATGSRHPLSKLYCCPPSAATANTWCSCNTTEQSSRVAGTSLKALDSKDSPVGRVNTTKIVLGYRPKPGISSTFVEPGDLIPLLVSLVWRSGITQDIFLFAYHSANRESLQDSPQGSSNLPVNLKTQLSVAEKITIPLVSRTSACRHSRSTERAKDGLKEEQGKQRDRWDAHDQKSGQETNTQVYIRREFEMNIVSTASEREPWVGKDDLLPWEGAVTCIHACALTSVVCVHCAFAVFTSDFSHGSTSIQFQNANGPEKGAQFEIHQ
uniref:Uncharacterized protein n=1 Tax=Timema shepardi TaxID=629360 RepID=A0A7R9FWQ4_TIMSH|nr:unnamed protein product [Timema shepardi]